MDRMTGEISTMEDFEERFSEEELLQKIEGQNRFVPVYSNEADVPRKFKKLIANGRWAWLIKNDGKQEWIVGVRRKSTGEERYIT